MKLNSAWTKRDYAATVVTAVIFVFVFASEYMPRIEGYFFHVVGQATLGDFTANPPPDYRYTWKASAEKHRDCDYIRGSITWYLGPKDGRRAQVGATFLDKPQIRGKGLLVWDGLQIDLNPEEVLNNSYATVRHQCPGWWRFWETQSDFYISRQR